MIKNFGQKNLPCRLSWLLVEVNNAHGKNYHVIHSVEVIGNLNKAYTDGVVRFNHERREILGRMRFVSDDLKAVEAEREHLASKTDGKEGWSLICLLIEEKVKLITIDSEILVKIRDEQNYVQHFLPQKHNRVIPVALLHEMKSEHQVLIKKEFFNNILIENYLNEESNSVLLENKGFEEAYLLIQYFENRNTLVYSIIRYKDTVLQEKNLFRNVVAYITNKESNTLSQATILQTAFNKQELVQTLESIKETCWNVDLKALKCGPIEEV